MFSLLKGIIMKQALLVIALLFSGASSQAQTNQVWTLLGQYEVEGAGIKRTEIHLTVPITATYLKFDNGYGGVYTSKVMVAPFVTPTVHVGYGVFSINRGWGSTFQRIAFDTNFGNSLGGATTSIYYTTSDRP